MSTLESRLHNPALLCTSRDFCRCYISLLHVPATCPPVYGHLVKHSELTISTIELWFSWQERYFSVVNIGHAHGFQSRSSDFLVYASTILHSGKGNLWVIFRFNSHLTTALLVLFIMHRNDI